MTPHMQGWPWAKPTCAEQVLWILGGRGSLVIVRAAVEVVQVGNPLLARSCQRISNPHSLPTHLHIPNDQHCPARLL